MAKYMTKQRKILLGHLSAHTDEAISVKQLAAECEGEGISLSAVYRNLAELEKENIIKRVSKSAAREVYYQYTDAPECRECIHLSCKKCGKTFHMDSGTAEKLLTSVEEDEGFSIDKSETVLYGVCGACSFGEKGGA